VATRIGQPARRPASRPAGQPASQPAGQPVSQLPGSSWRFHRLPQFVVSLGNTCKPSVTPLERYLLCVASKGDDDRGFKPQEGASPARAQWVGFTGGSFSTCCLLPHRQIQALVQYFVFFPNENWIRDSLSGPSFQRCFLWPLVGCICLGQSRASYCTLICCTKCFRRGHAQPTSRSFNQKHTHAQLI
jgi:hypothetical protein